ncbi:MAG: hypothetical protein II980_06940 [Clostridia bacterium]|nr:hypothetical protein [Clostridia bacterium]
MYYKKIIQNGSCFNEREIEVATTSAMTKLDFLKDITLEVSWDRRESRYQSPSEKEIRAELKKIARHYLNENPELSSALDIAKKEKPLCRAKEMLLDKIMKALKIVRNTPKANEIYERIFIYLPTETEISADKTYASGTYFDDERKIVLYSREIEYGKCSTLEKIKSYKSTLAHELFHAFHYSLVHNMGKDFDSNEYYASVVKESLASYHEKEFCNKNRIDFDKNFWNKNILYSPYSGARYIKDQAHFDKILMLSLDSMEDALDCLLEDKKDLAEKIKEKKSKTTVSKPTTAKKPIVAPISPTMSKSVILDKEELLEEFYKWSCTVEKKVTKEHARKRCSYVRRVLSNYIDSFMITLQAKEVNKYDFTHLIQIAEPKLSKRYIIDKCLDYVNEQGMLGNYGNLKSKKSFNSYKSGFKAFCDWFINIYC